MPRTCAPPIVIRTADAADAEAARRLICGAFTALCWADHRGDPAALRAFTDRHDTATVRAWIEAPDAVALVSLAGTRITGVALATTAGTLRMLCVAPQRAGHGVGKALLDAVLLRLRAAGGSALRVETNRSALEFFHHAGFEMQGLGTHPGGLRMVRHLPRP